MKIFVVYILFLPQIFYSGQVKLRGIVVKIQLRIFADGYRDNPDEEILIYFFILL